MDIMDITSLSIILQVSSSDEVIMGSIAVELQEAIEAILKERIPNSVYELDINKKKQTYS